MLAAGTGAASMMSSIRVRVTSSGHLSSAGHGELAASTWQVRRECSEAFDLVHGSADRREAAGDIATESRHGGRLSVRSPEAVKLLCPPPHSLPPPLPPPTRPPGVCGGRVGAYGRTHASTFEVGRSAARAKADGTQIGQVTCRAAHPAESAPG